MAASPELDVTIVINAPLGLVLKAFFDEDALGAWWQTARAVTTPRTLGAYAIEWAPTDFRDEILGRLGGTLRGTVMQFDARRGFFVADLYWLPPDGDPVGPMALEVACAEVPANGARVGGPPATRVRVTQNGFEESLRWRRYYEIFGGGLERALRSLQMLLEK